MSFSKTPAQRKAIRVQKEQEKAKHKLLTQELVHTVFSIKDIHRLILLSLPLMDQTCFNSVSKKWNKPMIVFDDEFNLFTYIKQLLLCHSINFKGKTRARNPLTEVTYSLRGPDLDKPYDDVIASMDEREITRSRLRYS